jgi:hypothetical protein
MRYALGHGAHGGSPIFEAGIPSRLPMKASIRPLDFGVVVGRGAVGHQDQDVDI